jgi:hypothetical protein
LSGPIEEKAAVNNPPYAYGIVERTFSEWKSSALDEMNVMAFNTLPSGMQVASGALNMAYQSAMLAGGTYEDGTPRTFTCQGCHMRADIGEGCNKAGVLTRSDLPKHDLTGGNYWMWPLIKYQDQQGTLRLGGGLTQTQLDAMDAGQKRGEDQLRMAANLIIEGNTVTIYNLTGHKLITGYPEGRRMWLNIKWYDESHNLVREDGAYGPLGVNFENPVDLTTFEPQSIIDLDDPNTKIYEVHPAITKEWAQTLTTLPNGLGDYYKTIPIGFDRLKDKGDVNYLTGTLEDIAGQGPGTYQETFHFALNNHIAKDNRIPPYGMDYDTAWIRNARPVPYNQYGGIPGGTYVNRDTVQLNIPAGATGADITLYYQGTSWEYVQFLYLANTLPAGSFLADEGKNFLDAWIKTGMVQPFAMASATWGTTSCSPTEPTEVSCFDGIDNDCDGSIDEVDPDCQCTVTEPTEISCSDSLDNDCDGFTDGADTDCQCTLTELTEISCSDSLDNDCDGFTDGADPDCQTQISCAVHEDKGSCNNDPACQWSGSPKNGSCGDAQVCEPTATDEIGLCGDDIDNDCDGLADCADTADCSADQVCQASCSLYTTRNLCNAQPACTWSGKNKVCLDI